MRKEAIVKRLKRTERGGFGFLRDIKSGEEIFFLPSALSKDMAVFGALEEGDIVEYEAVPDRKGLRAEVVIKVGDARPL